MASHHKAASCSLLPSMHSLRSLSTISTQTTGYNDSDQESDIKHVEKPSRQDYSLFPLPSFCLYSKSAILNEYAPESDIIQYLFPQSTLLKERLPMFVGVLQSLVTVVNDLPFTDDKKSEEDEDDEQDEIEEEEDDQQQFIIVGLNSIKLIVWKDMYDHILDSEQIYKNDLCLVIIVSSNLSDSLLLKNMKLLEKSIMNDISSYNESITTHEIGNLLKSSIEYWFEF